MNEFLELAERCEKANGSDRELDALIWCAAFAPSGAYVEQSPINGAWCIYHGVSQRSGRPALWDVSRVEPVTASIDAAMALAGDLRGLSLHKRSNPDMGGKDWLVSAGSIRSAARSWPLALCAVGLRDRAKWAPVKASETVS